MIEKAKKLSENSFTRNDASFYWYHNQDKSDKLKFEYNKYVINRYNNQIYTDYDFSTCSCHCFYKLYVCKHVVRVAELYDYKLKGYNKIRVFSLNSKRGPLPKKKQNGLTFD